MWSPLMVVPTSVLQDRRAPTTVFYTASFSHRKSNAIPECASGEEGSRRGLGSVTALPDCALAVQIILVTFWIRLPLSRQFCASSLCAGLITWLMRGSLRACRDAGLVRGEGFAVDASVIEADASRYHGKPSDDLDWSLPERQTRAVAEFLTRRTRAQPGPRKPTSACSSGTGLII